MEIKKTLVPKKNGNTNINYGFASTVNNNINIDTNNMTVGNLTADNITTGFLYATNGEIANLKSTQADIDSIKTSYVSSDNGLTIDGDITTYSNIICNSSTTNAFDKTVDLSQVITYLGDHNYYDELIGSQNSSITSHNINTEYLTVTKSAHFFELIIDKVKASGGAVLFTPADGFTIDLVTEDNDYYTLYWRACSEVAEGNVGETISDTGQTITEKMSINMWLEDDQAICQTFNVADPSGFYPNNNKYWWRVVADASYDPEIQIIDGAKYYCHWIKVYKTGQYVDVGSDIPEAGDEVAMLGNRGQASTRQNAIYIATDASLDSDLVAPLFAEYTGINDFDLASHKRNWIAASGVNGVPSTQIQGNILLTSGDTVQDYVDNAVAGIQTGSQFFTNLLVFENQNISVPCSYIGTPYGNTFSTDFWCLHGNTELTIASVTSNYSYCTLSRSNRTGNVTVSGNNLSYLGDTTEIPLVVTAYESGSSGTTIQYTGSVFLNKVRDGEAGANGMTPVIYDIVSDTRYRTLTYTGSDTSSWTIEPVPFKIYLQKTDYSAVNKVTNISTVPSGMTLFFRAYDAYNDRYSDYVNITSDFNTNGYWQYPYNVGRQYTCYFYLYNQTVVGNLTEAQFDNTKIYDNIEVPLLVNGRTGQNGTNGRNGVGIGVDFNDNTKVTVSKLNTLNAYISGNLVYNDGGIVSSYNWTGYSVNITNDNSYSSSSSYIGYQLQGTAILNNNTGAFSWGPVNINNWSTYDYSYRPTTLYLNVVNPQSYIVASFNMPIVFESGATLEITNSINATVQNQAGQISQLQITAAGLRTDVNNNAGDISTLQQTASGISINVQSIENGLQNTGIDITNGKINLQADKVTFSNSSGTVDDKISIDPTSGTLNAVDVNISGNIIANEGRFGTEDQTFNMVLDADDTSFTLSGAKMVKCHDDNEQMIINYPYVAYNNSTLDNFKFIDISCNSWATAYYTDPAMQDGRVGLNPTIILKTPYAGYDVSTDDYYDKVDISSQGITFSRKINGTETNTGYYRPGLININASMVNFGPVFVVANNFSNNKAAVNAGLTQGCLYHTNGVLKIVV